MHCPRLTELPPPPKGKTGWPWTVETPPLPPTRPDGSPWPRISIVTPSYNQGQFIEETIRSILLQGYPDLEYIIMDGGSTDGAVEIIGKYERWLTYWVSEKDRGQAHAINKGLALSTGEIFQWINSDDFLLDGAISSVGKNYSGCTIGGGIYFGDYHSAQRNQRLSVESLISGKEYISQPALWVPRLQLEQVGIDERLRFVFDWDMLVRLLEQFPNVEYIDSILVFFRLHPDSKTVGESQVGEQEIRRSLRFLSERLLTPGYRHLARETHRKIIWQSHLTRWWRTPQAKPITIARRAILRGLRQHRRLDRFWLGAVRRILLSPPSQ